MRRLKPVPCHFDGGRWVLRRPLTSTSPHSLRVFVVTIFRCRHLFCSCNSLWLLVKIEIERKEK
jgi:hypothetical protein